MSIETEPVKTTPTVPAQATKPRQKVRWLRWLWLVAGVILFFGLLALALVAARGSRENLTQGSATVSPSSANASGQLSSQATQHINTLVADPTDFQNLFVATDKGVLASSDGGKNWADVSDGLNGAAITALALDGNDPERPLYAGTQGAGLFKSNDGGKSWSNLGLGGRDIEVIAAYQSHVYLGVRGTFASVYASADGGKTFGLPAKAQLPPHIDVRSIAIDPINPNLVYIGTAFVNALHFPDLGRVKFSNDGGKTWRDLGRWQNVSSPTTLDAHDAVAVLLAVSSSRIYAGDGRNLYRLNPDQTGWQIIAGGLPPDGVLDVTSDPQVPTVVYVDAQDGFYRSTDNQTWTKISAGNKTALLPGGDTTLAAPALIAANTHNNAISVNNLNSTFLYGLGPDGSLVSYENREFGDNKLAPLPGGAPLPDFSFYGGNNPADPVAPPTNNDPNHIYFKETGHFVSGGFYGYWKQNGGLEILGLPLTEEFGEFDASRKITQTVQYFERAKFEYHAEAASAQRVQLALLGHEATAGKYFGPGRFVPTNATQTYFTLTNHTLRGVFYQFWVKNGGLGRFGLPLSEAIQETQADGRKLTVQYFERAKLESDNAGPVQIGLLGRQVLVQKGWLKK